MGSSNVSFSFVSVTIMSMTVFFKWKNWLDILHEGKNPLRKVYFPWGIYFHWEVGRICLSGCKGIRNSVSLSKFWRSTVSQGYFLVFIPSIQGNEAGRSSKQWVYNHRNAWKSRACQPLETHYKQTILRKLASSDFHGGSPKGCFLLRPTGSMRSKLL